MKLTCELLVIAAATVLCANGRNLWWYDGDDFDWTPRRRATPRPTNAALRASSPYGVDEKVLYDWMFADPWEPKRMKKVDAMDKGSKWKSLFDYDDFNDNEFAYANGPYSRRAKHSLRGNAMEETAAPEVYYVTYMQRDNPEDRSQKHLLLYEETSWNTPSYDAERDDTAANSDDEDDDPFERWVKAGELSYGKWSQRNYRTADRQQTDADSARVERAGQVAPARPDESEETMATMPRQPLGEVIEQQQAQAVDELQGGAQPTPVPDLQDEKHEQPILLDSAEQAMMAAGPASAGGPEVVKREAQATAPATDGPNVHCIDLGALTARSATEEGDASSNEANHETTVPLWPVDTDAPRTPDVAAVATTVAK